jgi:archaellum component FlaC
MLKNKWFWIIVVVIVILLILGFLYSQGLIKVKWQWLAMIFAGLAAPFKLISSLFTGKNLNVNKLIQRQQSRVQNEQVHRQQYDKVIREKEDRIKQLESEVIKLQDQVDDMELEKQQVKNDVNRMTDVNDLQDAFIQAYGDEG